MINLQKSETKLKLSREFILKRNEIQNNLILTYKKLIRSYFNFSKHIDQKELEYFSKYIIGFAFDEIEVEDKEAMELEKLNENIL